MPIYEYQCDACGKRFEEIQKFSDPPLEVCPVCGRGTVHRLLSSPAIHFKGSGWYITDYASKEKPEGGASDMTDKAGDKPPKSESAETKTTSETRSSSSDASTSSTASPSAKTTQKE